ncbi:deoxyribodipyrimidine photo-lyase [Rhizobium sp. SSA_523]|uniref:cryptochrome/photolyase family protein n=1 Tax=Rhizobium sp. SSA_523 TaxID=2952477 RepID=UPI002090BCB3|nr:deoxyribodipyrimidine photo-lyase [Rhizobium sp. SSA_523]MCO5733789.1 DNA photolyase family protein [Rhizobium sp. SSA_523]WKC24936.1 deoxyribodipyrimidine photo-lyase [Rhizobium sp. SSA_523]
MPSSSPSPVILWFRKDLRLDDNGAVTAAVESEAPVICIYIREPATGSIGPLGGAQEWWLHHSLEALSARLAEAGNRLILRTGEAGEVLRQLAAETGAQALFLNRLYERDAEDAELLKSVQEAGLEIRRFKGQLLHDPQTMRTGTGGAYRVYTPFWRALEREGEPRDPMDAPERIPPPGGDLSSEDLAGWNLRPQTPDWAVEFPDHWQPGENGARQRLERFIEEAIGSYKKARDFPGLEDTTSQLSPHLAFGEITPARVWQATQGLQATENLIHFRKELVWREFCYHLLVEFPKLGSANWNSRFDAFVWQDAPSHFDAWTKGMTGYPIVDAGMRQLWRHGYMHNRVRMITASFLIKDLMIDWRKGEAWFRDTLVDADPASNAANWQWVAGSGADASPFFRIFNPILQGEKFDPDGDYVRRFIPELGRLPKKYIHKPFAAPDQVLSTAGVRLGETYPKPIVDHGAARDRALQAYGRVKNQAGAQGEQGGAKGAGH